MTRMKRPKVGIYKLHKFNAEHGRWFGADFDYDKMKHLKRKQRPKLPIIDLNKYPEIRTEKQFLKIVYDNWGSGRYMLRSYMGRGRIPVFWKGNINEDGFLFAKNEYNKKEMQSWKRDIAQDNVGDYETQKQNEDLLREVRKELVEENRKKRYGFAPFLLPSGRRGHFTAWDSPEINEIENEDWGKESSDNEFEDWGVSKEKEFEKWD